MAGTNLCMIAFLFDSGKINKGSYGEFVFEEIIRGKEISYNGNKVIVSSGDILIKEMYDDILPFIVRDELCSIEINSVC